MKPEENESSVPRSGNGGRQGATAERLRETAVENVEKAGERARERIGDARHRVVDRIRRMSSALRSTSERLEQEDEVAARYAAKASDGIERVANYLSSADVGGLLREAEGFARKQPAVFYGGAFVVGLAAGRFFRSSGSRGGELRFDEEAPSFEEPGEARTDPMGSPMVAPGRRSEAGWAERAREAFNVDEPPSSGSSYARVPGPRQTPDSPSSSETAKKEKGSP